jgi:hypothetical protein
MKVVISAKFGIQLFFGFSFFACSSVAQVIPPDSTDTLQVEEDYSIYDNVEFSAEGAKRFCSPKIEGLSPASSQ